MQDESFFDNVRNELLVDVLSLCAWMCSPLIDRLLLVFFLNLFSVSACLFVCRRIVWTLRTAASCV